MIGLDAYPLPLHGVPYVALQSTRREISCNIALLTENDDRTSSNFACSIRIFNGFNGTRWHLLTYVSVDMERY